MTLEVTMPTVPSLDVTPLYALAGAGDVAVTTLRKRAADLQASARSLPTRVLELPTGIQSGLTRRAVEVQERLRTLPIRVQEFPTRVQTLPTRVQELPAQAAKVQQTVRTAAGELTGKAIANYGEWAQRGEQVVAGLRGDSTGVATAPVAKPSAKTGAKAPVGKASAGKAPVGTAKPTAAKPAAAKPAAKKATKKAVTPSAAVEAVAASAPVVTETAVPTLPETQIVLPDTTTTLPGTNGTTAL
jgi:hypothetical protein